MTTPRTAILIPAYNMAGTVGGVVNRARQILPEVMVIDDGSDDGTGHAAACAGAEVVRHPANHGKGVAIGTALRLLAARGVERTISLDADGQHLPEEIPKLLAESDAHPAALVLSVRDKRGQPIALVRRVMNWVVDRAVGLVSGRRFPDTQCGFRIYPVAATLALDTQGRRYELETEVLIKACRAKLPLREVVTGVHYPPVHARLSHFRPVEDTLRIALVLTRAAWTRAWDRT